MPSKLLLEIVDIQTSEAPQGLMSCTLANTVSAIDGRERCDSIRVRRAGGEISGDLETSESTTPTIHFLTFSDETDAIVDDVIGTLSQYGKSLKRLIDLKASTGIGNDADVSIAILRESDVERFFREVPVRPMPKDRPTMQLAFIAPSHLHTSEAPYAHQDALDKVIKLNYRPVICLNSFNANSELAPLKTALLSLLSTFCLEQMPCVDLYDVAYILGAKQASFIIFESHLLLDLQTFSICPYGIVGGLLSVLITDDRTSFACEQWNYVNDRLFELCSEDTDWKTAVRDLHFGSDNFNCRGLHIFQSILLERKE